MPYCSFVNNKVKNIRYYGKNPSCNTMDLVNKTFKKGMDRRKRLVLIMVKKEVDQIFQNL